MQVTFPSHHTWLKDTAVSFAGRLGRKIHASLPLLSAEGVSYSIQPLTEIFLKDFLPNYTSHIGTRQNPKNFDVRQKTLLNKKSSFPYFSFSLHENGIFIGGTIFSLRNDRVSYAYRSFNKEWINAKLLSSPAMIGEYAITQYARVNNKPFLSHGKDANPYGLNTAIGLASFKLSVGCRASVSKGAEVTTIDTDKIDTDCLILQQPPEGDTITHAYLLTSKGTEHKYLQVTKYPNQLAVEVLYRD